MVARKGKRALFVSIFCLLGGLSAIQSEGSSLLPGEAAVSMANGEAATRFGGQATARYVTTFHDREGKPAVHLFLVMKDAVSSLGNLDAIRREGRDLLDRGDLLIRSGQIEEGENLTARGRTLLLQEKKYGSLLILAGREGPSLAAYHDGLPPYIVAEEDVEQRAAARAGGKPVTRLGVVYFSPLEYYVAFEVDGRRLLVSPLGSGAFWDDDGGEGLGSPSPLVWKGEGEDPLPGPRWNRDPVDDSEDVLAGTGDYPDTLILSGVPDYNQPATWPNSCGPTAGACLLGYWDGEGYEDFLEGAGTYEDVQRLIDELRDAMGWSPTSGVSYAQVPEGLRRVIEDRGYQFGLTNGYAIASLDRIREEIVGGRPVLYGSQENPWNTAHYVVVVGYDGDFVVVHDNWWSTPTDYYVSWDALGHSDDMMTSMIPGESGSSGALPFDLGGSGGGCFISATSRL